MNNCSFTEKDIIDALTISHTGVWRLESEEGKPVRFYADSYMNMLLGVSDDIDPEERFRVFFTRIYKDDMEMFNAYYSALKNENQAEVVYRYIHPEMGVIYVRCGGRKVTYENGIHYYRGFHQNVNETVRIEQQFKNQLTKQAELYRSLAFKMLKHSAEASAVIDLNDGSFDWYTSDGEIIEEHLGYDEVFADLSKMVPDEYREEYLKNASVANLREVFSDPVRDSYTFSSYLFREEYGELRRITYWYYRFDDVNNKIVSVFNDTTEDYLKEKQLADALLSAKQANRAKTVFLNNMSHDIRTPMNAIIGFTELAEKYITDTDKCSEYLEKIKTSSRHLLSLINDVLDMSRIESGRMKINEEICSTSEIIQGINTIFQADAKDRELSFITDFSGIENDYVWCDKLRVNQVLMNCTSNAIKFTNAGGTVRVSVVQNKRRDIPEGYAEYSFSIKDTGIGMSEDYLKDIFLPFSREENKVHTIQGTGLGMAICKNIVDLMGGLISVHSKQGVGSEFIITIRFEIASKPVECPGSEQSAEEMVFEGKRVLLAEDNELNREIAIEILEEYGMQIECAVDGLDAVEKVMSATENYDLILMDIQMPRMNGYEAAKAIRAMDDKAKANIPIIAMTANAFDEDRQKAFADGMNGHAAKPIEIQKLLKTIAAIME